MLRELAAVLTGNAEPDLARRARLAGHRRGGAVPRAHRYTAAGLEKYRAWQEVWALQRREDAGEKVEIPVPPKYTTSDFPQGSLLAGPRQARRAQGAVHRLPRRCAATGDPTPVLGWAGWDHREQALALARELADQDALGAGDDAARAAGGRAWSSWSRGCTSGTHEVDPAFGISPAAAIGGLVDQYLQRLETTRERVDGVDPARADPRASSRR